MTKKIDFNFTKIKFKMQHKTFGTLSIFCLGINAILASLYSYGIITNIYLSILLKSSPLILLILLTISYFFLYRLNIYALIVLIILFLCLTGDVFMSLYPKIFISFTDERIYYIVIAGISFFSARLLLCVLFSVIPYRKSKCIKYPLNKLIISHFLFTTPGIIFGTLYLVYNVSFISISFFVYTLVGFGIPLSYSFLRIFSEVEETYFSKIVASISVLLFNISDLFLMITMLGLLPSFVELISINIYWFSMYLLTISIVRSSDENIEKGIEYIPTFFYPDNPDI